MRRFMVVWSVCLALGAGCVEEDESYEPWMYLSQMQSGPDAFAPGWSLCEAVHVASGGAGLYEVLEIRSNALLDPGHVRVDLRLQEAWSTIAPRDLTLRLPTLEGDPQRAIALRDGEFVGLLLLPPMADNQGFSATLPPFVFRVTPMSSLEDLTGTRAFQTSQPYVTGPLLESTTTSVSAFAEQLGALEARLERPHTSQRSWDTILTEPPLPISTCVLP